MRLLPVSATASLLRPRSTEVGLLNSKPDSEPTVYQNPLNLQKSIKYTWSRSLPVSATTSSSPLKPTSSGDEKLMLSVPSEPNFRRKVPLGQNTWTRWLPVSATAIRPIRSLMATPCGDEKFPSPAPNEPNEKAGVPLAWNTCIRWLPVSATATTLSLIGRFHLHTATSSGDKSSPSPEPSEPNV